MFFTQKDLSPEDIMLLDTQYALYIWVGKLSNKEDQRLSIKTALEYLQTGNKTQNTVYTRVVKLSARDEHFCRPVNISDAK